MHLSAERVRKQPTSTLEIIPSGAAGVKVTLHKMRQLVRTYKKTLPIRNLAVSLVSQLRQKDWPGEIRALHAFVRDRIRYVRDIQGVETLHTPEKILSYGQGDCDDKSILLATLLASIGHPTRFVAVGFRPGIYQHVFVETRIGKNWIPLETTEPVNVGWSPKNIRARMVVDN